MGGVGGLERGAEPADEPGGFLGLPRGVEGDEATEHVLLGERGGEVGPAVGGGHGAVEAVVVLAEDADEAALVDGSRSFSVRAPRRGASGGRCRCRSS